ncbi:glucosamine-6-phosphate deaminase [bacterium]|nr:glucosamine-6-phosphate deaminase [bacterium]
MEVIIQPDAAAAARLIARLVARALRAKPHLVLGLATGRTMERLYPELVRLHAEEGLDFSQCRTFNLDEYIGLPPDHPHSYRYYMDQHLFNHVNIDRRNAHLPNGLAADIEAECERYERLIQEFGGIDLQVLGIGRDGHIGFNEPLSALRSRTRGKTLTPVSITQNAALFDGDPLQVPRRAITMGVGTILECDRCLVLVTGMEKAAVLAQAVEGPVTSMISASGLQLHPRCTFVVDEEAAGRLQGQEYYRWVFEHEPEWQAFRES